jgi:gliding motility-associated protein GldL
MGLKNIVESKAYKNFMAKLYGWGASIVIVGALFKIQHYPGAGLMLGLGLGTEALIFFMSAFEPQHIEPDWSLVYPELWGLYHENEPHPDGFDIITSADNGKKLSTTQELDKMLEEAKIGPELIASLGEGMRNLSENALKLSGVSSAAGATDAFVSNLSKASDSVEKLNNIYDKTSESLTQNVGVNEELANSMKGVINSANKTSESFNTFANTVQQEIGANEEYVNSLKLATESAQNLANQYTNSAANLTKATEAIDFSEIDGKSYGEQIQKVTKNLSALNAVYELQLQNTNEQLEKTQQMQKSVGDFVNNINETSESVQKYKEQAEALAKNLSALNSVYGNMLSAMNMNINK